MYSTFKIHPPVRSSTWYVRVVGWLWIDTYCTVTIKYYLPRSTTNYVPAGTGVFFPVAIQFAVPAGRYVDVREEVLYLYRR